MYKVPFVCIVLNNGYLGLIRQAEKYIFDMEYEVQIWYDSLKASQALEQPQMKVAGDRTARSGASTDQPMLEPENKGQGFDFVKFAEACGAVGERVTDPNEIKAAFKRGVESGVPYIIDIITERTTDCSMGVSIDAIKEFE